MLEIKNIVKQYANHRALDDVSMYIPEGKIFGLLGPNGAGKTSLIRIINQITAPDQGIIYFEKEVLAPKHIGLIGYLPEERGLYKKMKVAEQMIYLAQLKGLSKQEAKIRLGQWFDRLHIEDWANKKIEDLSKGMQQKVQFISTVIHHPKLIILDEPFSGFDPINAQLIQDEILKLNKEGATIIYSTHRMETVEDLCDNIALINKAKKVLDGSVKDIKRQYSNRTYTIDYVPKDTTSFDWEHSPLFKLIEHKIVVEEHAAKIQLEESIAIHDVIQDLVSKINIQQIIEVQSSIHDIFIEKVTQPSTPIEHA